MDIYQLLTSHHEGCAGNHKGILRLGLNTGVVGAIFA